jgi:hypothetical protein
MTSQRTCLPPINTSFRFEAAHAQPTHFKQEHQNYSIPQSWYPEHLDACGNHYTGSWMPTNSCALFEDVQLRHHGYDNMFWREN